MDVKYNGLAEMGQLVTVFKSKDCYFDTASCPHKHQHPCPKSFKGIDGNMQNDALSGSNNTICQAPHHTVSPSKYDFSKIDEVKRYCTDRIDEIECINCMSNTPSSFVCIAAFIGFLSRLVFGNNSSKSEDWKHGKDKEWFESFVDQYLPNLQQHKSRIYQTFRSGIVHSMSFHMELVKSDRQNNEKVSDVRRRLINNQADLTAKHNAANAVSITHSHSVKTGCDAQGQLILNAFELCSEIRQSIVDVFTKAKKDTKLSQQILDFVKIQVPITAL